jgi:hypothetical protein
MRTKLYALIAILTITLAKPSFSFGQSGILTGNWQLSYIKDTLRVAPNGAARPDNGVQLTFSDNGTTGQFHGTFFCNGVSGTYSFEANHSMKITGRDTTNNPCYDEKTLWIYFNRATNYKIVGSTLMFFDNNSMTDKLIFTKVPVVNGNNQINSNTH